MVCLYQRSALASEARCLCLQILLATWGMRFVPIDEKKVFALLRAKEVFTSLRPIRPADKIDNAKLF